MVALLGFYKITFLLLVTLLILAVICLSPRKNSVAVNIFLFLVMSVVETVAFSILTLNLEWIVQSEKPEHFIASIIIRSFTYPLLLVLFGNFAVQSRSARLKWWTAAGVLAAFYSIERLASAWHLRSNVHWHEFYSLVEAGVFMVITYWLGKWFASIKGRLEVERHDNV